MRTLLAAALLLQAQGAGFAAPLTNDIPTIDLRPAFTNWALPLRLQGGRGTCSVFTMAGALEYALAREQQHGTALSIEFLNWASNQATTNSHDGGFFSDLWTGFLAYGVCPETDMPYRQNYDSKLRPAETALRCANDLAKADLRLHWIKPWDVRTGLSGAQVQEIKRVLSQRWPVCSGLRWPKKERWQEGILRMAPPEGVFDGHSVLLVGYADDPQQPGGGTFLIRNSGGGVHDGAITYEYASAYVNDAAWVDHGPGKEPTR
jgi:C1A family cysteine protease